MYSDEHKNKSNINNFSEGLTDLKIRDKRLMYQYNSLSPLGNEHGYALSLACQSGTDMVHTTGKSSTSINFITTASTSFASPHCFC